MQRLPRPIAEVTAQLNRNSKALLLLTILLPMVVIAHGPHGGLGSHILTRPGLPAALQFHPARARKYRPELNTAALVASLLLSLPPEKR